MTQKEKHLQALHNFTERVRNDPSVIALLLDGSLAYGTVWEKSDIDLVAVIRDGTGAASGYAVDEGGIDVSLSFTDVSKFKNDMRKWRGDSSRSQYALGSVVFTKDETLRDFIEEINRLGDDDAICVFLAVFNGLWSNRTRAEKWVTALHDPLYAQRFLQWCCTDLADMILFRRHEIPNRESVPRAMELEPELMREFYVKPSTTVMTEDDIRRAINVLDDYLSENMAWWSEPILDYLSDGEVKTQSQIHKQLHCGLYPLDYLASKGVIERVTQPSRVFKHSKLTVDEVSYFYIKEAR